MKYLAIDVETANANYSSICQIGIAEFDNGIIINKWSSLINPESYFDPFNISIHGIKESDVKNSPTFDEIYDELVTRLEGQITVHHMPFDKIALNRVCDEYQLPIIKTKWLDSAKITRRTWEQFAYSGYGLKNMANYLNISFDHHDALEDAIAAGLVVTHACSAKKITVDDWFEIVGRPINRNYSTSIKQEGNSEGSLFGENLVFTGTLSLPRKEAAIIAAKIGCNVLDSVTRKTTILVVGTQDSAKLAGYEKSSKHRKAEELINEGTQIKILSEKDFIKMCTDEDESLKLELPLKDTVKKEKKEPSFIEINLENLLLDNPKKENTTNQTLDYSHKEKRNLGNESHQTLKDISYLYEKFDIKSFDNEDIDILFTIESEIDQISEYTFDLMKNKIHVNEYQDAIDESINFIEIDLEEKETPMKIHEYAKAVLMELQKIRNSIII